LGFGKSAGEYRGEEGEQTKKNTRKNPPKKNTQIEGYFLWGIKEEDCSGCVGLRLKE